MPLVALAVVRDAPYAHRMLAPCSFEFELRRAVQNMMQKLDASAVRTKDNTLKEYFVSFDNVHFVKKYVRRARLPGPVAVTDAPALAAGCGT